MTQEEIILKYRIDKLEECLDLIQDEIANNLDQVKYKIDESYMNLVLGCTAKSLLNFYELILLCKNGLPDGAFDLARNLFEQFIIISIFETQTDLAVRDEIVEKYYANYDYQKYKNLKKIYEYKNEAVKIEECNKKIEELKTKFLVQRFNDYWWAGFGSFTNICGHIINKESGLFREMIIGMYSSYVRSCCSLHASSFGNMNRIGNCGDWVDIGPIDNGQEYALDLAIKSFTLVVMVLYRELGLNSEIINKKLNELMKFYQDIIIMKNKLIQNT